MALPSLWGTEEYFIPLRLMLLARMIEREMTRDLQVGFNLTVADWRVLATTCSNGSSSAAEIRSTFEADRAEVSRAVARLLKADLIQREPDSSHRQKMRIIPTEAGRAIFDGVRPMRAEYFEWILQDFSAEERTAFEKAIKTVALRVDERRSARSAAGA
jgi:DNA-binding MarR family transcriptional regulator